MTEIRKWTLSGYPEIQTSPVFRNFVHLTSVRMRRGDASGRSWGWPLNLQTWCTTGSNSQKIRPPPSTREGWLRREEDKGGGHSEKSAKIQWMTKFRTVLVFNQLGCVRSLVVWNSDSCPISERQIARPNVIYSYDRTLRVSLWFKITNLCPKTKLCCIWILA